MKEEKCIIQHACQISQQSTRTTDWRQRCPRPESVHPSYREDNDTFLQTHEASLIHMLLTVRFYAFAHTSVPAGFHVLHEFSSFYVFAGREEWNVKWSVLIPRPPPGPLSCSPARPLKPNRGITVSLPASSSKMKWERPRRLYLIIFTRERHSWVLKHLLGFNTYGVGSLINNRRYEILLWPADHTVHLPTAFASECYCLFLPSLPGS